MEIAMVFNRVYLFIQKCHLILFSCYLRLQYKNIKEQQNAACITSTKSLLLKTAMVIKWPALSILFMFSCDHRLYIKRWSHMGFRLFFLDSLKL